MTETVRSINRLKKREYLDAFDTSCERVAKDLHLVDYFAGVRQASKLLMDPEKIKENRVNMMLAAYYKFGPVSVNYLQNQLMLPLQDVVIRIKKYEVTENTEYLLDAMNYLMLAYWQYTKEVVCVKQADIVDYKAMLCSVLERRKILSRRVMDLLSYYIETDDLCWISIIACIVGEEAQYPTKENAFYAYTDGCDCEIAGTNIKELEHWKGAYDA